LEGGVSGTTVKQRGVVGFGKKGHLWLKKEGGDMQRRRGDKERQRKGEGGEKETANGLI